MAVVMVVEDNPTNLKLVDMVLRKGGYQVHGESGAEAALAAMQHVKPDLVLMDVQLPGMDGFAAVRAIRADASIARIPVIALTAFAMRGDEERILAAGFDGYIAKPVRYAELLQIIARFVTL
jgi:two-component system cell cycle response regulator DivK